MVALVVGAAAATGAYALLDSETIVVGDPEVIVAEVPAPGTVAKTHNEAVAATAISAGAAGAQGGIDEAATAAAISPQEPAPENRLNRPGPRTN